MLILHLADLHFRRGEVGTAMDGNAHLRNELTRDAETFCRKLGAPDVVAISGDIAYAGHRDEYAFALDWLDQLCRRCGTTITSVFAVPGNHDVARATADSPWVQAMHKDIKTERADPELNDVIRSYLQNTESSEALYRSIEAYNLFAQQFFCHLVPSEETTAKRDLPLNDGSLLRLRGLNSVFVSSSSDKRPDLFVDPSYLQLLRDPGVETLTVCHHPLPWLRNGDAVRDQLNAVVRIQLFGHDHTNRIEREMGWIRFAASAAQPSRTELGWKPGYNLIEVSVEGSGNHRSLIISAHVREWQSSPDQFVAKMDGTSDVFRHKIDLAEWEGAREDEAAAIRQESTEDTDVVERQTEHGGDPMDNLRDLSVRFFRLSFSEKSAIAGSLRLLEDEDISAPDVVRFTRILTRARERGQLSELDRLVTAALDRKTPQRELGGN